MENIENIDNIANMDNMANMDKPKCPENVQTSVKQIENHWKRRPDIKSRIWLPKIKCYSKNVRLGLKTLIMVSLWPEIFSQPKFLDEPKNQQF